MSVNVRVIATILALAAGLSTCGSDVPDGPARGAQAPPPLAPAPDAGAGADTSALPWSDVPDGVQFTSLQSYHACQDNCGAGDAGATPAGAARATRALFYAATDYCVCTCADGSFVESHTYNRTIARELAATWTAICPAAP